MVDFSDVRRESETTFLFFASSLQPELRHALEERQITDWQFMTKREALQYLPDDFQIPEVRLYPGAPRVERMVSVFVSHFNTNDMAKKLNEIQSDEDILKWANDLGRERAEAWLRGEIY